MNEKVLAALMKAAYNGGCLLYTSKIKKSLDEKKKICSGEKFYKKAKNHHNPPHRTSIACL